MIIVGKGAHARQCSEMGSFLSVFLESDQIKEFSIHGREFTIGFGSIDKPQFRQYVFDRLRNSGFIPVPLYHSSAIISRSAKFGRGVQVHAGAIIQNGAEIGDNCIINTGAIVSHDCKLGKNVHLTPGAVLAGNVEIGDNSVIGMNATVYKDVKLPANTVILNGQHVKDCKRGKVYFIRAAESGISGG